MSERDRVFSPADATDIQLQLPARDVPIDQPPTMSNLAGRFSLAVALGRRSALRDLAAVATALAVAAVGAWLLAMGTPVFIVALTMLAMAVSGPFWGRGTSWSFDALSPALIGLGLWLAARGRRAALVVIAAATIDLQPWTAHVPGASIRALVDAFTPLGTFLMAVGLAVLLARPLTRLPVGAVTVVLLTWHVAGPRSPFDSVSIPVAIGGWAAVAAGLMWIQRTLPSRAGYTFVTLIAGMVIAQPALTRERFAALGRDLPAQTRTRLASDLRPADVPQNAAIVTDAHRADVMVRLAAALARRQLRFIPQAPGQVRAATDEGLEVFAFDNARAHLERLGFMFERESIGNTSLNVIAGAAPCLDLKSGEWHDVSLLIGTGSFVLHGSPADAAPGGMVLRAPKTAVEVSAIEPRSIPFEVNETGIRVPATGRRDPVIVTLTTAPARAEATAEDGPPVRMCPGVLREPLTLGRANTTASIGMDDVAPFAEGWHPLEADPDFFRWTAAPEALVRVSLARPSEVRVTLTATPAARASQTPSIGLIVNGCRLPAQGMPQGQGDYEWVVDSACWRPGMNHLWIAVTPLISPASLFQTHDNRLLGARIGAIRLVKGSGPP